MMKRVLSYVVVALGTLSFLSCGGTTSNQTGAPTEKKQIGQDFNLSDTDSQQPDSPAP